MSNQINTEHKAQNSPLGTSPFEDKKEDISISKANQPASIMKKSEKPQFLLDGMRVNSRLLPYNGLIDQHLAPYFCNDKLRIHLQKMGLITNTGHIIEGKKKKIRRADNITTSSNNETGLNKLKHKNLLAIEYCEKLPQLTNGNNDSNIILPKIYLANMKIEVKSVREAGLMPKMKNPSDHLQTVSAQQKINKKKHNAKLESLSKDDLNKIFQKYKDKVSSEGLESANGNNNYKEDLALNNNNYNNSSNNNNKGKHSKKMSLSSPRQKKDNKPEPIQEQLKTTENLTEPTKDQTITIEKIVKKDESPIKEENQNSPLEIKEEPKLLAKKSLDKTNEPDKPVQINLHAKKNINLKAQKSLGLTEPLQKPNEETKEIEEEVNNEKNIEDIVKLESPIKENEIIKESPLKPDTSKDQNEYDEEIFEESIEKN